MVLVDTRQAGRWHGAWPIHQSILSQLDQDSTSTRPTVD